MVITAKSDSAILEMVSREPRMGVRESGRQNELTPTLADTSS